MFKINNIVIKNGLILAPMAGVSDVGFRSLAIEYGADYAESEMVSAKALLYNNKKTLDLLNTAQNEKIKVVQLFGHEPTVFEKAVKHKALEKFDIIDINMGCPAPKIVNNFDGASLLKNIDLAKSIIESCVKNSSKPITVKFRIGWDANSINAVEFAKMCENAGASAITVHGRVKSQGYSGTSNLEVIKAVVEAVNIPVIANGDIVDKESAFNVLNYTKASGIMIGRGALGNPEIFSEILGKEVKTTKFEEIKKHIEILRQFYPDNFIIKHIRKHILWYLKNEKNCKDLKNEVVKFSSIELLLNALKNYYLG